MAAYMVASKACRAYGITKPRMIFHLYLLALLFSCLHSTQGVVSGSGRCAQGFAFWAFGPLLSLTKGFLRIVMFTAAITSFCGD